VSSDGWAVLAAASVADPNTRAVATDAITSAPRFIVSTFPSILDRTSPTTSAAVPSRSDARAASDAWTVRGAD
jgi:hypothetical protein